jgi:hypothetical protein
MTNIVDPITGIQTHPETGKVMKRGPRYPGSIWGEIKPIVPKARKASSIRPEDVTSHKSKSESWRGASQEKIATFRTPDAGFDLTPSGQAAYENLMASTPTLDLTQIEAVEERVPGDRSKIIRVMEALALGARHKEALADEGWVWSNFSIYRNKYPVISSLYVEVARLGEETRKVLRLDEAHRRATEGVTEPIYSPSGKYCGEKIKYSDALLTLFLKADHPDKFTERHEVKSTGVVLKMQMGLRENVKQEAMTQSDIKIESPFADEKKEEIPGGI